MEIEIKMKSKTDPRVIEQLDRIYEPRVVAIPPINAYRDLVILPNGEIRHYGIRKTKKGNAFIYISSRDYGLSWQEFYTPSHSPGACVKSPWSGDWITILDVSFLKRDLELKNTPMGLPNGLYVCRSKKGIDAKFEVMLIPMQQSFMMVRQPIPLKRYERWLLPAHYKDSNGINHIVVLRSDDDGYSWQKTQLEDIPACPILKHHRGLRWQTYGCEPTIVEFADGRIWMLIRTSHNFHYESYSDDGGINWTTPVPSRFYACNTMPTLFKLTDGRILIFWCNTTPLPEIDHSQYSYLEEWEKNGFGEDVFTNRDVIHAAISEDNGKTWIGFREVFLNEHRNDSDFRTSGGSEESLDKSVHQSQAIELPHGKVMLAFGQHHLCRRIIIFDPAWLYEKERSDDFSFGLQNWSIHLYVKSIIGNFKGISGHCAYNRRPGAQLIPSPDGNLREVLQIARHPDPRLVEERQGAVWNFPSAISGKITLLFWISSNFKGCRISIMDRWFNPSDITAYESAIFTLSISNAGKILNTQLFCEFNKWQCLTIKWNNTSISPAYINIGTNKLCKIPLLNRSINGASYIHIQSTAINKDCCGILIKEIKMKKFR